MSHNLFIKKNKNTIALVKGPKRSLHVPGKVLSMSYNIGKDEVFELIRLLFLTIYFYIDAVSFPSKVHEHESVVWPSKKREKLIYYDITFIKIIG